VPFGFFQEAPGTRPRSAGSRKYKWDVYDCMQRARVGLEEATDDDPLAQATADGNAR
jgi:hypothetical protein